MNARFLIFFLHCFILGVPHSMAADKTVFRFGVLAQADADDPQRPEVKELISELEAKKLAFVVANGIKSADESCTDELYNERRELFEHIQAPLVPSLTAGDWAQCVNSSGKPASVERLNRLRELFFSEASSFGERNIQLVRQSIAPQFRSYGENARWRVRNILFATIHLPENNNNYAAQAGRNNEFEDRLIANREWMHKLFALAERKRLDGIVLFSDGNPLARATKKDIAKFKGGRDGFQEIRQHLHKLASGFPGKILIIHRQVAGQDLAERSDKRIRWTRNLGEVGLAAGVAQVSVLGSPSLFEFKQSPEKKVKGPGVRP